jgi:hypothetical protein
VYSALGASGTTQLSQGELDLFSRVRSVVSLRQRWVALTPLLLAAACSQPTVSSPVVASTGEWRTFEGNWSASGTRRTLNLGENHHSSIFDLTGELLLVGNQGLGVGFQARAMGFADSLTGMQAQCVWTDEHGDKVYSELKGEFVATGNHIVGTFLGGTGRYAGLTGEYSFQWQYVLESEDGATSGRAVDLRGRALLGSAAAATGAEHSQ